MTYGSEVWGPFGNFDYEQWDTSNIEIVHLYFCKYILGVNRSTTNNLVRGELGEFPIKTLVDTKSIEFYKHLSMSENEILTQSLNIDKELHMDGFKNTLTGYIGTLQQNVSPQNTSLLTLSKKLVKKSFKNHYQKIWRRTSMIQNCPKSKFVSSLKKDIKLETYLVRIEDRSLRTIMTKFRISDHDLKIEKGRYMGIKRTERHCPYCHTKLIENENHFLVDCPLYDIHRKTLFKKIKQRYPVSKTIMKTQMLDLFRSSDTVRLVALSSFLSNSFLDRYIFTTLMQIGQVTLMPIVPPLAMCFKLAILL